MARGRRGSSVKKGLKFFLYGAHGTWKSSFALESMKLHREDGKPLRVVYIDTEGGSVDNYLEDLEAEGYSLDNLYIYYTNSYTETVEFIDKVIANEDLYDLDEEGDETDELILDADGEKFVADMIIIDSATVIQDTQKYSKILVSEKRAELRARNKEKTASEVFVARETAGLEFKDYDKLNHQGKNFLQGLVSKTDKYVCVTSREKPEKEQKPDGKGGYTSVATGKMLPDCFKGAQHEFYTVLWMFADEESEEIKAKVDRKDRTGVFEQNEIIESPSMMYWQSVIDKNKDRKKSITMPEYEKSVEKDYVKETEKYPELNKEKQEDTKQDEQKEEKADYYSKLMSLVEKEDMKALSGLFAKNKLPSRPSKKTSEEKLKGMIEIVKEFYEKK